MDLLYTPNDEVTLDFKLHTTVAVPDFVWALVTKGEANSIKKERWDLVSQFPRFPFFSLLRPPILSVFLKLQKPLFRRSRRLRRILNFLPTW